MQLFIRVRDDRLIAIAEITEVSCGTTTREGVETEYTRIWRRSEETCDTFWGDTALDVWEQLCAFAGEPRVVTCVKDN